MRARVTSGYGNTKSEPSRSQARKRPENRKKSSVIVEMWKMFLQKYMCLFGLKKSLTAFMKLRRLAAKLAFEVPIDFHVNVYREAAVKNQPTD